MLPTLLSTGIARRPMNCVDYAHLNGLGEVVGELMLPAGWPGKNSVAREELLEAMDDIHNTLVTIDFPMPSPAD